MLHVQLVGDATDDLAPIETFRVGQTVVLVAEPTGFVWRVRHVMGSQLVLERPSGLRAVTRTVAANDVITTSRSIRSPLQPSTPTVITPPTMVSTPAKPLTNYILIGVGVLAVLGLGIAAARSRSKG